MIELAFPGTVIDALFTGDGATTFTLQCSIAGPVHAANFKHFCNVTCREPRFELWDFNYLVTAQRGVGDIMCYADYPPAIEFFERAFKYSSANEERQTKQFAHHFLMALERDIQRTMGGFY
jgi:hypothetical protein